MSNILPVERLRLEYRNVGDRLRAIKNGSLAGDAEWLRLEAREIEIVDELRALGVPPEVLVGAA